jgi:hypothetical protein
VLVSKWKVTLKIIFVRERNLIQSLLNALLSLSEIQVFKINNCVPIYDREAICFA